MYLPYSTYADLASPTIVQMVEDQIQLISKVCVGLRTLNISLCADGEYDLDSHYLVRSISPPVFILHD